jgi:hypothetical protein
MNKLEKFNLSWHNRWFGNANMASVFINPFDHILMVQKNCIDMMKACLMKSKPVPIGKVTIKKIYIKDIHKKH